jgi:meiotically up-regulated gene 157 (Mug157) protein
MCYKETDVLNKLYAKLGYFYYYNNEQFTHITETFDNEIQKVMKMFTTEIGATVTDTVQVYQEIASVQF